MAKMIPSELDRSATSSSECRIFDLLQHDPATEKWIILHSLGLVKRGKKPFGEIDFVVMIPDGGLICLEIKGGRVFSKDGIWLTQDRNSKTHRLNRSPFMQAREGMFELKNTIRYKFGVNSSEAQSFFAYGVIFPDVRCPPVTPEFERSDVIDFQDLRLPISKTIKRVLDSQASRMGYKKTLKTTAAKNLKDFLRPDFDLVVAKSNRIKVTEEELVRLTTDQYTRLNELEENPRCFFEGAAGTGKTLLAIEYSRRQVLKKKKVLLLCYNRLLGFWLEESICGNSALAITVGSFHSILRNRIMTSSIAYEYREAERNAEGDEFFRTVMPLYGLLSIEEHRESYDVLVVDEAQDLVDDEVLDILDRWVSGGLAGGNWAFFGDFTHQAIYKGSEQGKSKIGARCDHFVKAKLIHNCRNTRRIAEETSYLSGFNKMPYKIIGGEGLPVEYHYWTTEENQIDKLEGIVKRLLAEGIEPGDIVVLGPRKLENSFLKNSESIGGLGVVELSRNIASNLSTKTILYSTIHSYKGLESPVIILVDINYVAQEDPQALLYVGMSRARSLLCLLLNKKARDFVQSRIKKAMSRKLN